MDVFNELLETIKRCAVDNKITITNVELFVSSWQKEKEFKGTKGKWVLNEKYQTIEDSEGYGIAQQNGIKNSEKWLNDALLISKSPELLDSFISAIILLK